MLSPGHYQLTKATQVPVPWPGTSQSLWHPGDGEGVGSDPGGLSTGRVAGGPHLHVLAGMAICRGQEKPPSPLLSPVGASPCNGSSCHAALGTQGICATEMQTQNGGKNPARLNFVPFNTRVITTSGNLPPTQLCARINWKSVITITNNSLLAFIASEAWRSSHRQFPL